MARSSNREALLDAAARVLTRGAQHLTLDTVAREAGVSKGGLLYHFPSKDALALALLHRELDAFDAALDAHIAADPDTHGAFTRAYLNLSLTPNPHLGPLFTLAAQNLGDDLLTPIRARYATYRARTEADGVPGAVAHLIVHAADGLWFTDLLGLAPLTATQRADLHAFALDLLHRGRPT
ncbi:TetR/AcrR family transcriptional regulator [Deinococcus maricopensis]|uniref:Regulatory protein TetR n=1 Tax=Deinococcus maricopensis (strain DSM 21211 / LMG 22137 / NRRL B-23946 / LB-34) TaxID=709986 RepID=E8U9S1_DEIML|nr:TetR family transcriptional regulator [Deinococcus maricopensis]ADV67810.1 regulatory protein TetR [Deinococcus maricopensis DSM 21211]